MQEEIDRTNSTIKELIAQLPKPLPQPKLNSWILCKYPHKPSKPGKQIVGKVVGPAVFDCNDSSLVVTHFETFDPDSCIIRSLGLKLSNGESVRFDNWCKVNTVFKLEKQLVGITSIYHSDDNLINNLVLQFADGTSKQLG